ncbi:MAG: hypothetical protein IKC77_08190 [Lentisphaeria bacterium]|nr:hypothetical protein [Lentisphaeria bacterium]
MRKMYGVLLVSALASGSLLADVKVPGLFSDHAVLQKSEATAVFGKADPGEKVSVSYGNASASVTAEKDGKWLVRLDLSNDDGKSKTLKISGKNTLKIKDVITGDVWLAAGQSNMQFRIENSLNSKEVIKNSANNSLRTFKVTLHGNIDASKGKCAGAWYIASPKYTKRFSAVAYHFGKKLNEVTDRNIGLIDPAWGSSSIEAWMSRDTLMNRATPAIAELAKKDIADYTSYDAKLAAYIEKYQAWMKSCGRFDSEKSSAPPADAKWISRKNIFGAIKGGGIVWFRKTVDISGRDVSNGSVYFRLGRPGVPAEFYLDGRKVGSFSLAEAVKGGYFRVSVPATEVAPGKHEMTVKVFSAEDKFSFGRAFYAGANRNNHTNWQMCYERTYAKLTPAQKKAKPAAIGEKTIIQKVPTAIWNGMMTRIVPYTLTGVIWYQGESNSRAERSIHYADHQKAFVEQLRREFGKPDLPYYSVQLAAYMKKSADASDGGHWPELRRQQELTTVLVPNTCHVNIIDCGEAGDIHPIDKKPVGERLANVALANVYGKKDVQWKSPLAVKAEKSGSQVRVFFDSVYGGLEARKQDDFYWVNRTRGIKAKLVRNSPSAQVEGFAVCGKDGKWFWADKADIDGNCVVVFSSKVADPVAVRYAWQNNPTCNLFSKSGLPASSFRFELK